MKTEKRLIDANALVPYLWALFEYFGSLPCSEADKATQRAIKRCIGEVKKMPTVDAVEVVHGRWVNAAWGRTICNNCGEYPLYDYFGRQKFSYYCPNCGAKMNLGG